jgi:hypothetical protein
MARSRNWAPQSKRLDRPGREQPPCAGAEARQLDPLRAVVDAAVPEMEAVPPIATGRTIGWGRQVADMQRYFTGVAVSIRLFPAAPCGMRASPANAKLARRRATLWVLSEAGLRLALVLL